MNELAFSRLFRKEMKDSGFRVANYQDCKSDQGCPDLGLLRKSNGHFTKVELKVLNDPGTRIKFQPGQAKWMQGWVGDGGSGVVITFVKGERLWVVDGSEAKKLERAKGLSLKFPPLECASLSEIPWKTGWSGILALLLGK